MVSVPVRLLQGRRCVFRFPRTLLAGGARTYCIKSECWPQQRLQEDLTNSRRLHAPVASTAVVGGGGVDTQQPNPDPLWAGRSARVSTGGLLENTLESEQTAAVVRRLPRTKAALPPRSG